MNETKKIFNSRLSAKNINISFIQNYRNKLKVYAATNCNAESAVSGVKEQLNIHIKLAFDSKNELMSFKRNRGIQRLSLNGNNGNFTENTEKEIFNGPSLRSLNEKNRKPKQEQKVKAYQDMVNESMSIGLEKKKQRKRREEKNKNLDHIHYGNSE